MKTLKRHRQQTKGISADTSTITASSKDNIHLFGIKTAPAWPPLPSNSTFILAGAAIAVTMPIDIPGSENNMHYWSPNI